MYTDSGVTKVIFLYQISETGIITRQLLIVVVLLPTLSRLHCARRHYRNHTSIGECWAVCEPPFLHPRIGACAELIPLSLGHIVSNYIIEMQTSNSIVSLNRDRVSPPNSCTLHPQHSIPNMQQSIALSYLLKQGVLSKHHLSKLADSRPDICKVNIYWHQNEDKEQYLSHHTPEGSTTEEIKRPCRTDFPIPVGSNTGNWRSVW